MFCKTLEKIDKQPRNFRMGVWSRNRLDFGTISGKSSTSSKNVTTGILASDKGGGIYVEEGSNSKRDKGHIDFSLTATGVHNKYEKISTSGNPEIRIIEPGNRLSQHGSKFANGKSKNFNSEMQKLDGKSQTNVVGDYKLDRFALRNSTSSDASIFANKNSKWNIQKSNFPTTQ